MALPWTRMDSSIPLQPRIFLPQKSRKDCKYTRVIVQLRRGHFFSRLLTFFIINTSLSVSHGDPILSQPYILLQPIYLPSIHQLQTLLIYFLEVCALTQDSQDKSTFFCLDQITRKHTHFGIRLVLSKKSVSCRQPHKISKIKRSDRHTSITAKSSHCAKRRSGML